LAAILDLHSDGEDLIVTQLERRAAEIFSCAEVLQKQIEAA